MELLLPNDAPAQAKMQLCLDVLRSSVNVLDALGFDAKVYYEEDKRLADMQSHDRGVNVQQAVASAANLRNLCEAVLHNAGWQEYGKEN